MIGCRCIWTRNIPLWIGAFFGIVALGAALEADNIGTTVEVVETPSRAVVVRRTVGEAWTVRTVIRSWCKARLLRQAVNWLRSRGECAGLLAACPFLVIHSPLSPFKQIFALGLQLNSLVC